MSDLQTYLQAMNSTAPSQLALEDIVDETIQEIERKTRYAPFLADGSDETAIAYTPNGTSILDLKKGMASVASVSVGVSATSSGTVLTADQDYWTMPNIGVRSNDDVVKPITYIQFADEQYGAVNSIEVVGDWGWAAIPITVYNIGLKRAAAEVVRIKTGQSLGAEKIKEGPVMLEFPDGKTTLSEFMSEFDRRLRGYTRASIQ